MTKSPWKNLPNVGIELRAACMPSEHASIELPCLAISHNWKVEAQLSLGSHTVLPGYPLSMLFAVHILNATCYNLPLQSPVYSQPLTMAHWAVYSGTSLPPLQTSPSSSSGTPPVAAVLTCSTLTLLLVPLLAHQPPSWKQGNRHVQL